MVWYDLKSLLASLVLSLALAAILDMVRQIIQRHVRRRRRCFPPGPTPLPILGNVLSVDNRRPWLTYSGWQKIYGDIIYVRLLDTDVVVLNSVSVATDLLEKRSRIYSDRPFFPTLIPYGNDCNFAFASYGDHWRLCRRIFHQTFNANAVSNFRPMQMRTARKLIWNMIDHPNEYPSHFQTFSAAIAMSAVYDYEPSPQNDPMVSMIYSYLELALGGLAPAKVLLLKLLPFLLYIPEWLPGSWIRRETKEARAWRDKVVETPYQYVRERMISKDHVNAAMVSDHIARMEKLSGSYRSEYETALKYASTTAFLGSAETTSSTLMVFALAMVQNPHVWKRAQESIDAVIGTDRPPEFSDRQSLPYIEAIMQETMRWRPVTPGVLRAAIHSDTYRGYYIPKGATILVNVYAMTRDEARYPNADKFIPERFLDVEGKLIDDDPRKFIFGLGRRICPGRHSADASIWSAIVTMLATLDFNLAKDTDGNDIVFEATFTSGITDNPDYFPCRIRPRAHVDKEWIDRALES